MVRTHRIEAGLDWPGSFGVLGVFVCLVGGCGSDAPSGPTCPGSSCDAGQPKLDCALGTEGCQCREQLPYCDDRMTCVNSRCEHYYDTDGGSDPGSTSSPSGESFGAFFEYADVVLQLDGLGIIDDATSEPITAEWSSAMLEWNGTGEVTEEIIVWLARPGTSGSRIYPGPRWLKIALLPRAAEPIGEHSLVDWTQVVAGKGYVIYVDTDDQTQADAIDPADVDTTIGDGFSFAPGTYWGWGEGNATLEKLDGMITGRGPELDDDGGQVSASINLDGVKVMLPSGGSATMQGGLSVQAQKAAPPTGGGTGGTGGAAGTGGTSSSTLSGPPCTNPGNGWFCVDCEAESMGVNPYGLGTSDIQVWSECASACTRYDQSFGPQYANPTDQSSFADAINASCGILAAYGSQYRDACRYCP